MQRTRKENHVVNRSKNKYSKIRSSMPATMILDSRIAAQECVHNCDGDVNKAVTMTIRHENGINNE